MEKAERLLTRPQYKAQRAELRDEAAYGHSRTRTGRWYENEPERHEGYLPCYWIMTTPVTMEAYARFVSATHHRAPDVDQTTWEAFGLIHTWVSTRAYAWRDGMPPPDKADHPVVLVSHDDARAYADWLSLETGQTWRLPSEAEWEKAARGTEGAMFPWGETWDPTRLNSHDLGPFATTPVGTYPAGASPFGMLDAAGQVFEWTDSPAQDGRYWVKGGSWDDRGCGVCRPADRHSRPAGLQHILVGFRLVLEP